MIVSHMELAHPLAHRDQERSWKAFLANGTRHSALAQTLPSIVRRCEAEGIPYRLTAYPGMGYFLEPVEAPANKGSQNG